MKTSTFTITRTVQEVTWRSLLTEPPFSSMSVHASHVNVGTAEVQHVWWDFGITRHNKFELAPFPLSVKRTHVVKSNVSIKHISNSKRVSLCAYRQLLLALPHAQWVHVSECGLAAGYTRRDLACYLSHSCNQQCNMLLAKVGKRHKVGNPHGREKGKRWTVLWAHYTGRFHTWALIRHKTGTKKIYLSL